MPKTTAQAKQSKHAPKPQPLTRLERVTNNRWVGRIFVTVALSAALATTCLWAILGASLQNNNADQLVDSYLFENAQTVHGASFPGQHTFLFKWPLFWLQHVFGYTPTGFIVLTTLVVLVTVGGLAYLLWRIERRPFMFGLLCLALASALLLVPPVPYPGALLPVNMAMLTTRNLEYLLYILGLVLVAGITQIRSKRFVAGVGCLGLLFASDRLFGTLSLGGSVVGLVAYGLTKRLELRRLAWRWLIASMLGLIVASIFLALLDSTGVVHIVGQSTTTPYGLVPSLRKFVLGSIYALFAFFTNLGANPAASATTLAAAPQTVRAEIFSVGGFAYLINGCLLVVGLWACLQVLRTSFSNVATKPKKKPVLLPLGTRLALMLIASTVVAAASYVVTNHEYLVDSRYLTIEFFAVFVSIAVYSRTKRLQPQLIFAASAVLLCALLGGSYLVSHTNARNSQALSTQQSRNSLIVAALKGHPTEVVVGDYWRVLPLKLAATNHQKVLPLASCTTPRNALTSDAWQPDLRYHSFTYVLTLDGATKDFTGCTLEQVIHAYGRPNASTVIAGTNEKPREVILFYDKGIRPADKRPVVPSLTASSSILHPISIKNLKHTTCPGHSTIMQVVAHEDDDLLFMNPDLEHAIQAGDCVRTVYVTAGDAGSGKFYWLGREQGSQAAYSAFTNTSNLWQEQTTKIADHEFATVSMPVRGGQLSLIFLHLPDGSPSGQGFGASNFESLAKLKNQSIGTIHSVDHQSYYSAQELVAALTNLMDVYQPDEVRTQLPYSANMVYADHSDHTAVGGFTTVAYEAYATRHQSSKIAYYAGYPIHAYESNVTGSDLDRKERAFFAYSDFDKAACANAVMCDKSGVYGAYLTRQYRVDDLADPQLPL
ncbi:MAG TPA: PIG-L family deacetylase [Candidatus Microsaccharimonas sp.]|nr:PIG-L family deacetylase [Candidatus Microsaccharimonas sp.]